MCDCGIACSRHLAQILLAFKVHRFVMYHSALCLLLPAHAMADEMIPKPAALHLFCLHEGYNLVHRLPLCRSKNEAQSRYEHHRGLLRDLDNRGVDESEIQRLNKYVPTSARMHACLLLFCITHDISLFFTILIWA